ncbi:MAG: ABC transporter permease [Myxococcales bacterium]|nr:ABC transporter permease [Myxococcales bacterium]
MLTTTLPLVMLALWSAVAREAPVGRFGEAEFTAYFLGALVVRTLTGSWVVWEMNQEIRTGTLSMRLLRPIHPFVAYAGEHLAAIPMRAAIALPAVFVMVALVGGERFTRDPRLLALAPLALAGAWAITFLAMLVIGSLGLFIQKSVALFEVWLGLFAVLSGYLVPLELLPPWLRAVSAWLPFRYMLGFPVEVLVGLATPAQAVAGLAAQAAWALGLAVLAAVVWRAGLRRFEAHGG